MSISSLELVIFHLEICLKDLEEDHACIPLKVPLTCQLLQQNWSVTIVSL